MNGTLYRFWILDFGFWIAGTRFDLGQFEMPRPTPKIRQSKIQNLKSKIELI